MLVGAPKVEARARDDWNRASPYPKLYLGIVLGKDSKARPP